MPSRSLVVLLESVYNDPQLTRLGSLVVGMIQTCAVKFMVALHFIYSTGLKNKWEYKILPNNTTVSYSLCTGKAVKN